MSKNRPDILTLTTGAELRRWYWLKAELGATARHHGLKTSGGKFQILDRLAHFLDTGETVFVGDVRVPPKSKFDWHKAPLTAETIITDNYQNTQNVRRFFKAVAGSDFKFTIALMDWMRGNVGKTLGDAVMAHHQLRAAPVQTQIKDHNQFNQYTRDFMANNPGATMEQVLRVWAKKRSLPSDDGRHRYSPSDLDL